MRETKSPNLVSPALLMWKFQTNKWCPGQIDPCPSEIGLINKKPLYFASLWCFEGQSTTIGKVPLKGNIPLGLKSQKTLNFNLMGCLIRTRRTKIVIVTTRSVLLYQKQRNPIIYAIEINIWKNNKIEDPSVQAAG